MKINAFYRETAALSLNGSIVSLVPASIIIVGNLLFFDKQNLMVMAIPFFLYSFISFQFYLYKMRQSLSISRIFVNARTEINKQSLFAASCLLVFFHNAYGSDLKLFFPNGHLAGTIKRERTRGFKGLWRGKTFALFNDQGEEMGCFIAKGKKIAVYDRKKNYLGYFNNRRNKKELVDAKGKFVSLVEGSAVFMDEKVITSNDQQAARLRRGWMQLEWSALFPNPNTPVLSFSIHLSEQEKLLTMPLLINEFFIER